MAYANFKLKSLINKNAKIQEQIKDTTKRKNPVPITSIQDEKDQEYQLQFQILDLRREVRFLTATVEETQNHLTAAKKRAKFLGEKLDGKIIHGENIVDEHGVEFVLLPKFEEENLRKDIEQLRKVRDRTKEEMKTMEGEITSLKGEICKLEQSINDYKEREKKNQQELKYLAGVKNNLQNETTEMEQKSKEEKSKAEEKILKLQNCLEANEEALNKSIERNDELDAENKQKEEEMNEMEDENYTQAKTIQAKETLLDEMKEKIRVLQISLSDKEERVKKEEKEKQDYKEWLIQLKVREEKMKEEKDGIIEQKMEDIKEKDEIVMQLKERIKKLKNEIKKMAPKPTWKS